MTMSELLCIPVVASITTNRPQRPISRPTIDLSIRLAMGHRADDRHRSLHSVGIVNFDIKGMAVFETI